MISAVRGCLQDEGVEVALDNHVLNRLHCDLEQVGVGRVGVVHVDFLLGLPDEIPEFVRKELLPGFDVGRFAVVVWEDLVYGTHTARDLFPKKIDLVQEENQR